MSTNYNPFEGGNQQQSQNNNPFGGDSTFTGGNNQFFTNKDAEAIDYDEESKKKSIYEIGREYFDALNTGWQTGTVLEEYLEVFKGNHSPEAIEAMVKAGDKLNKLPQNDRMAKYIKSVDDAGGGLWNGIIELANTDGALVASQVALQSLAMMVSGAVDSGVDLAQGKTPDVFGYMAAGAGIGAGTFGVAGSVVPGLGNIIGAGGGAVAGAMGGLSTALENGLTFVEMMKEKIEEDGGEYNRENIKSFLEDDNKYNEIRNDALKRGLTIGAVDMLTGGIAGAVGVKVGTSVAANVLGPRIAKGAGILAGTAVEGIGGGIGEAAGQLAGGQEMNAADIILETFAETPGAAATVVPKVLMEKPKYTITENRKEIEYTREQFLEQIDGLNDESIAMLDIKIDNDNALAEELFTRQNDFVLRSRIDDKVPEERRTELVELEKERQKLEKQSKLTGLFAKPNAKEKLLNIEAQMKDIIDSYAGIDGRTSEVRARRKTRENINNARKKILMDRIQTGVEKSKAYDKKDISIDNVTDPEQAAQMRLDQEEKNAMYDMGLLEAELENTVDNVERAKIQEEIRMIEEGVSEIRNNMNEAKNAFGFLLEDSQTGKMKIVVNEKKAIAGGDGAINVAAHEFLHAVLNKAFNTRSNNYAVKTARGLGASVGGALFQYMKTLDDSIATNSFMGRLLSYAEAGEETMGQEVLNLMSDSLVDGSFNPDDTALNKIGDMFSTFFESVGLKKIRFAEAKDVYRFIKNFNKSIQGDKMAGRVVKRAMDQGGDLIETTDVATDQEAATTPMSKSGFQNEQVINELGLGKETIGIVAKNTLIENQIIKENIKDKDGNVMASPAMQRALAQNNLPRAFALARQAANKGNELTLEEGLKINSVQDFFSEYSLKLVELARTYRAVKDGKRVPFGAYMNTLLPKKYSGILDKLKSKIETSSMTDEKTAKKVSRKSSTINNLASTEVEGRVVALESIDQEKVQRILVEQVIENDTKLYKYKDVKSELTAHRKFTKEGVEITPELKAKYKKQGKKAPKELKSLRKPIGRLYSGLEAVSEIFGKDIAIRIIKEQDLTTEQRKSVQDKILRYFPQVIAMMPFGTTASGDATGIANTGLGVFYKKLARTKMKNTGTGKGLAAQQKQYIDPKMFKQMAGLVRGARVNNTSVDGFLRAVIVQVASIANNQAIRQAHGPAVLSLKDGKASTMFAKDAKKNSDATNKNLNDGLTTKIQQKENGSWPSISEIHKQVMVDMNSDFGRQDLEQWLFEGNGREYLTKAFLTNPGNFTGTTKKSVDAKGNPIRLHTRNLLYRNVPELKEKVELELNKEALIQYKVEFDKLNNEQKLSVEKTVFPADSKYNEQELEDIANVFKKIPQDEKNLADNKLRESKTRGFELIWRAFDQMIEDNPANGRYILALLSSSSSQQKAFIRTGSLFGFTNTLDGANVEEHTLAASDFAKFLYNRLMERNLFGDFNFFERAVQSYIQGSLPLKMDNNLSGSGFSYKNNAGKYSWDVFMGLKPIWIRYINPEVNGNNGGVDPNVIKLANGNTLAEEYGVGIPEAMRTPGVIAKQQEILFNIFNEINTDKRAKMISTAGKAINNFAKLNIKQEAKSNTKLMAVKAMSPMSKKSKGITVLDFDDTLATTKSLVKYTTLDGKTGTLNAEQFASTYENLLDKGYTFDFSDFNKVVKGKLAPLFKKAMKLQGKFGPENMFVLTARPPQAAKAIFDFLKANGLNIPLRNITGLGNSTAEAKALWMADKVADGYNDFYFADDALQNVQAVQNMLNQFDVKSKVQQAKVKFSKDMSGDFNKILEDVTGIEAKKRFSAIKARKRGADKGKFRFFIPPSHEDFVGLLYNFLGKGKEGNAHMRFFEESLIKPLNRGYRELDTAKQAIANDYKSLNKEFADVKAKFKEKTPDGDFTYQDAVRVYLWDKHGYNIPGLSPTDQKGLVDLVKEDSQLQTYAETLNIISKQDAYVSPTEGWEAGDIRLDLIDATGRVGRAQYFTEFNENAEIMFSEENLNKIEAAYGTNFRSALEDILHRISTGINRPKGQSATVNKFMNYLNGSVGSVMFLNMRSAVLQQMSIVNYLNFADNNIASAAAAFANQPQYWKDFAFIFNSDMLKQRRGGIGNDINGAELAEAVSKSKNPIGSAIGKLLQLGFTPTQIGDSIAIAAGGSTFYRNRINKYIKDGMSKQEAEAAAFTDFQDITQSTQQSARPDMTSQQQASWIGKVVLNFQNITSQYNRLIKKAASDIYNRRTTKPNTTQLQSDLSNTSRILYYGAVQNIVFYSLQTALFALMFGTDDEDDDKKSEQFLKKQERVVQGTIDSLLRGSGIYGAVVSTLKNMYIKWQEQREKNYNKDESAVIMEMLNFSPVVGIKARKMVNAEKTLNYNKKVIKEMETFDIDNPMWSAVTNYVEGTTNAPVNRLYNKTINVRNSLDNQYTAFQRIMFFMGYTTWSLDLGDTQKMKDIKQKIKDDSKKNKKKKQTTKNPWSRTKSSKKIKNPWQ